MSRYLAWRIVQSVVTLWAVVTVVFLMAGYLGNPVLQLLPPEHTEEQYRQALHLLGYDRPLWVRYWDFLSGAVRGDFGTSVIYDRPAMPVAMERLPLSMGLAAAAVCVAAVIGIPLGVLAGYRAGGTVDRIAVFLATVGQAVPVFVVAISLILLFGVRLRVLPVAGIGSWKSWILPVVSLSLWVMAAMLRFARSGTLETMRQSFVLLARAKGLSEPGLLFFHVLRCALLPLVTFGGLQFGMLISGAVITENVFALPGLGSLVLNAANQRDGTIVQAAVVLVASAFILINLLTDLTYAWLDPRVQVAAAGNE